MWLLKRLVIDFLLVEVNRLVNGVFSDHLSRIVVRYLDKYLAGDLEVVGVVLSEKTD